MLIKKAIHVGDKDFELNNFSDEALSEFYLCHVLEHFSFNDITILIHKIYKKLKKVG